MNWMNWDHVSCQTIVLNVSQTVSGIERQFLKPLSHALDILTCYNFGGKRCQATDMSIKLICHDLSNSFQFQVSVSTTVKAILSVAAPIGSMAQSESAN